jgi:hypothetical protein
MPSPFRLAYYQCPSHWPQQRASHSDTAPTTANDAPLIPVTVAPTLGIQLGSQCPSDWLPLALFEPEHGIQGIQEIHDVSHGLQLS